MAVITETTDFLLVHFTIKSFVDEYTTEEVKVEAEEGQTILAVAQENGASLNCNCFYSLFYGFSILWRQLSLWGVPHQDVTGHY